MQGGTTLGSHSFCATICDRGQNKSQQSTQNIHHSPWSSHYISLIFAVKLVKFKALKPKILIRTNVMQLIFSTQGILTACSSKINCSTGVMRMTYPSHGNEEGLSHLH